MPIYVHNLSSGDTITYSVPLLIGEIRPSSSQGFLQVHNCRCADVPLKWPVVGGKFRAVVEIFLGENRIELRHGDELAAFVVHLRRPDLTNFVRPIYIRCRDDSGEFQGPEEEDTSSASAIQRISLAARLLQTFTAEKLNDHGLGRHTFALETDINPTRSPCPIFESRLTVAEAHAMTGAELWTCFARELMSCESYRADRDRCKWFAFMSFTRYSILPSGIPPSSHSEVLALTKGHTALGGGGLALYGTGTLHCWAQNIGELVARFTDCRRIDRTKFMDDSAYREFYWANYATGLGAALHELGHTFDLAHTPTGIMARGFDDIHRVFTVATSSASSSSNGSPSPSLSSIRCGSLISGCQVRLDGSPCSRDASPVPYSPGPYSPKQSPVRRPSLECNSLSSIGSPHHSRHSSLSRPLSYPSPTLNGGELQPLIVVESAFTRLHVQTSHTTRVKNYDGSDVTTTTTRHKDGVETVSEVTSWPDSGRIIVHELVRNLSSGKTRTTMSMSTQSTKSDQTNGSCHSLVNGTSNGWHNAPLAPTNGGSDVMAANTALAFQETRYKDGGAHWYRSSAVLLRYHKWLNVAADQELSKNTVELTGNIVRSSAGLRLVELRCLPEGTVCHHWEFVCANGQQPPPTEFTICIDEVRHLAATVNSDTEVAVVVEDNAGNVLKRKTICDHLRAKKVNGQLHL